MHQFVGEIMADMRSKKETIQLQCATLEIPKGMKKCN